MEKIKFTKGGNKMISPNVLLIDNGSDTLDDYLILLNNHKVKIVSFRDIATCNFDDYQLIVLSDGHSLNVSKNIDEINLICNTSIPVVGICYGFQLLCFAYGAKLVKLPKKSEGLIEIIPKIKYPIFSSKKSLEVLEKHRFAIQEIPEKLSCLAYSKDGCEIIEVKGKKQAGLQFHPEINNPKNDGKEIFDNLIEYFFGK